MSRSRLWVVSELYYPEETSTGYFITKIAEGLAADFDVAVVCAQPSYAQRGVTAPRRERHLDVMIHRVRSTHFDKNALPLRLLNLASFTIAVALFLLFRLRRGDRLLVVTNPPTVPFVCGWIARVKRCRATLLVHDIYPEVLAATGVLNPRRLAFRLLQRAFDHSFRLFDHVVVLGRDMFEVVGRKLGRRAERMVIIPNWGDVDEVTPLAIGGNAFQIEHKLVGRTVIQFSGNFGRTHGVELFVGAARALAGRADTTFLAVGGGGKASIAARAAEGHGSNLVMLPRQPRERLAEMLNASTATLIAFVDGMYGISVPSRMYNVMAAGRPIIAVAHPRSELALTVAEEDAGWVLDPATAPSDLMELVCYLATAEGRAEANRRGAAGRRAVERRFTLSAALDRFRRLLQENDPASGPVVALGAPR